MDVREISAAVLLILGLGGPITQLWINVALSRRDRQDSERTRQDVREIRNELSELKAEIAELRGAAGRTGR